MKVELNGFIVLHSAKYMDKPEYIFCQSEMKCMPEEYVSIQPHSFTVEIDEKIDVTPKIVAGMREKQKNIRAEAEKEIIEIEERIQSLLCLENKA